MAGRCGDSAEGGVMQKAARRWFRRALESAFMALAENARRGRSQWLQLQLLRQLSPQLSEQIQKRDLG